jgi:tetratricopeptide (TPR) repeat protein
MADFYRSRRALSAGSLFFIVFFLLAFIALGYFFYIDQGRFWDYSLYIFIPAVVVSLILMIFYFVKRSVSGYVFLLFFLIFLTLTILSSFIGPFALINSARDSYENSDYSSAISDYEEILEKYPASRYALEASENIAQAYYLNGDHENAIKYFQRAVEDGIVDGESIEIIKILADSNLKLAEHYFDQKEFAAAAEYYLKTVVDLEEITEKYPDTNDAFIASYKIPEYLYQAASSAGSANLWEKSKEILEDAIKDYPESEYLNQLKDLLFYNILRHANLLKSNDENRESLEVFLEIFDLDEQLRTEKQSDISYYRRYLFENTPSGTLVQLANEMYYSAEYEKAMFIYDYILENFPDYENTILENVIEARIKIIQKDIHEMIVESDPVGSFASEETSKVIIENRTDYDLTQYISGPEYRLIRVEKNSKTEIEISSGSYRIAAELDNPDMYPFYGEITYEEGNIYRQVYELKEEESS